MRDDLINLLAANGLGLSEPAKLMAGSLIDPTSNASGTTQDQEDTLNTVTLPANFLSKASRGILIAAFGTTAANANNKTLKVKVGSTVVATTAANAANAKDYLFLVFILRTAADTQVIYRLLIVDGALVAASCGVTTAAIDESEAQAITQTGTNTAAAAASATGKGLSVILLG